jgi:hypothetical protein
MSFGRSVRANSKKLLLTVNNKVYAIARELFNKIVEYSPSPTNPGPFADGYLVNQWYTEEGKDFSEELGPDSDTSPSGQASKARIQAMKGFQFNGRDGAVTLVNNTHYAYRAEALGWPAEDGWSGKIGPYRMVARALQLIGAKYK